MKTKTPRLGKGLHRFAEGAWPGKEHAHPVSECIDRVNGKVDDPGAYCASIADKAKPGWREDVNKHMEFPTDTALQKYLAQHPKADRSRHSVKSGAKPRREGNLSGLPGLRAGDGEGSEVVVSNPKINGAGWKGVIESVHEDSRSGEVEYATVRLANGERRTYHVSDVTSYDDAIDKMKIKGDEESDFAEKKPEPKLRVPLVIGHDEDQELLKRTDLPAAGWVDKVWREGDKLVASATKVPKTVKELLARKAFRTVSSEIYKDFPQGEKGGDVGSVLRRVAILGGEIPQVKTLDEINALYKGEDGYDIPRLEIFHVGSYNGETWTDEDLDEMVENFNAMTVDPDKHSEMVRMFDEGSATFSRFSMPLTEAPKMPHDKVITDLLSEAGIDTSTITDSVPATFLAESARVISGFMEEAKKHADEAKADEKEEEEKEEAPAGEKEEDEEAEEFAEHDCPECQGTGMKDGAKCEHCKGTGKVEDTTEEFMAEKCTHSECPLRKNKESHMAEAKKFSELSGKLAGLEKSIQMREASERRAGIDAEIAALLASGKVLPAELDGGLKDALYAADTAIVCKFSEGGKQKPASQLDLLLRSLKARPAIAKFAERMGTDGAAGGGNGARMSAERKAELLGATHLGRKIMAESSKSN